MLGKFVSKKQANIRKGKDKNKKNERQPIIFLFVVVKNHASSNHGFVSKIFFIFVVFGVLRSVCRMQSNSSRGSQAWGHYPNPQRDPAEPSERPGTPAEASERQISSGSLAEGCAPRMVTLRNFRMQTRHFRRFCRNPICSAGDKTTVSGNTVLTTLNFGSVKTGCIAKEGAS